MTFSRWQILDLIQVGQTQEFGLEDLRVNHGIIQGLLIISKALQFQGSDKGIVLKYRPLSLTKKLKMHIRSVNDEFNCMPFLSIEINNHALC